MNQYAVYCTEGQTRKALELGAPITELPFSLEIQQDTLDKYHMTRVNGAYYEIPTSEQMIGWLEEKEIAIILITIMDGDMIGYNWLVHTFDYEEYFLLRDEKKLSRREATLAAIDAALDFLIKNKK